MKRRGLVGNATALQIIVNAPPNVGLWQHAGVCAQAFEIVVHGVGQLEDAFKLACYWSMLTLAKGVVCAQMEDPHADGQYEQ